MINITFSDSLAGCLKMADYYSKERKSEIRDLKENLFSLYLNLDLGDISEQSFGKKRENDFVRMFGNEDISFMSKWFNKELKKIAKIEKLVKKGHFPFGRIIYRFISILLCISFKISYISFASTNNLS